MKVLSVLTLILTLIFYYSLTLPLLRLVRAIAAIKPHNPAEKIISIPPAHKKNEMGMLIGTLNSLLQDFATSLDERKTFEEKLAKSCLNGNLYSLIRYRLTGLLSNEDL